MPHICGGTDVCKTNIKIRITTKDAHQNGLKTPQC
jgi:hypothetical protein